MLNGSRMRVPLAVSHLETKRIIFEDDARELFWPSFFAIQKLQDRGPVKTSLPDGSGANLPLEFFGNGVWGTKGSPELWGWLLTSGVTPGDALIIEAVDGDARQYGVSLDVKSKRDEEAVRERTRALEQAARNHLMKRRPYGCPVWDMAKHLLAVGHYRHPVPPEPLSTIWRRFFSQPDPAAALTGHPRQAAKRPAASTVHQLKIGLSGSHRPIWRRVLVNSETTLDDLHWIIQVCMGWTNSHLHQFKVGLNYYSDPAFELDDFLDAVSDESRATLGRVITKAGARFTYEYDFGDSWQHQIEVEKILPAVEGENYPQCIAGEGACPPEDCGGVYGYRDLLDALDDPTNPDHDDTLRWVGREFDPDHCDQEEINRRLRG
ncbi:MAG TPA: plasmid pRiA4b ORF-3 family protein [Terriglobia bacterium]|nr:plasmid pRiA4b ORF-3 family protein [Terriglobia bacterium]